MALNLDIPHEKSLAEKASRDETNESIMEELRFMRRELMELKALIKKN